MACSVEEALVGIIYALGFVVILVKVIDDGFMNFIAGDTCFDCF